MTSQLFKENIPNILFYEFIETICIKNNEYFILDKNSFKLALLKNNLKPFCDDIKKYYHSSKQYYVTRELNYNKFITMIRQICNINNIKYFKKITYFKSRYELHLLIKLY
jgi:hypothetical protein